MRSVPSPASLLAYPTVGWMKASSIPFCLLDQAGNVCGYNDAFGRLFGIECSIGPDWFHQYVPVSEPFAERWQQMHLEPAPIQHHVNIETSKKERVSLCMEVMPLPEEDIYGVSCKEIVRSVGQSARQSDQGVSRGFPFVDSRLVYYIEIDMEGCYTFMNDYFCERFGIKREDGLGILSLHHIHPEDHRSCLAVVKQCIKQPGQAITVILRKPVPAHDDFTYLTTQWEFTALTDPEGTPRAISCVGIDASELIQSQQKLDNFTASIKDILITLDENSIITYASPLWAVTFGHEVSEVVNKSLSEFMPMVDVGVFVEEIGLNGSLHLTDQRLLHKDGSWRWVEMHIEHRPETTLRLLVIRDVTEHKVAQQTLLRNTELLNQTQQLALAGGWEVDYINGKTEWTDQMYHIHEIPVGEPLGEDDNWLSFYHPDDREDLIQVLQNVVEEPKDFDISLRFITAKKRQIWVRLTGRPILVEGKMVGLSGLLQDITAYKEVQLSLQEKTKLLETAQSLSKMGYYVHDFTTNTFTASDSYPTITGIPKKEIYHLDDFWAIVHPEDRSGVEAYFRKLFQDSTHFRIAYRCIRPLDGEMIHVMIWGQVSLNEAGEPVQLVGVIQDITEQKQAEASVRQREEQLHKLTQNVPGAIIQLEISPEGEMTIPFISEGIKEIIPQVDLELFAEDAQHIFSFILPEDLPQVQERLAHAIQHLSTEKIEYRVQDGERVKWVRNMAFAERKADGTTVLYGILNDISEEKHNQTILKRSKSLLEQAQSLAQIGSYHARLLTRVVEPSKTFREMLGWEADRIYSMDDFNSLIHPEDRQRVLEGFGEVMAQGLRNYNDEFRCLTVEGKVLYVNSRTIIEYDDAGNPQHVFGVKQDITQQKLAAKAMGENEARLRLLTDNMQEAFWLRSADNSELFYISPAYESIWGKTCASLYEDPNSFVESIHPDDYDRVVQALYAYQEVLSYEIEHRIIWPNGRVKWVWVRQDPVYDEAGNIISHTGIATDITARKQSEALIKLLEAVVENSQDAVLITRANPIDEEADEPEIVYANTALYEMTGYSDEEIIGKTPRIFQCENTDRNKLDEVRYALENRETAEVEVINARKDGSEYWVNFFIAPISDDNGNLTHWVSIQRDVTERKLREFEIIQARDEAQRASKAKSAFLSTMSHEIRTPLNAIIGMTGLLDETRLTNEQSGFLHTIRQGGESLLSVITDILDYSKIEAGQMELETACFDLLSPIEDTLELLAEKAQRKHIALLYQAETPIPLQVMGDATRIRQVLVNLVGNAIKFTERGEIVVSVRQLRQQGDSLELGFSVRDTGIGIPADKMHRLFRSFSQVDASTTREHGGTGLGLAISKQLVELHGGRIGVESTEGEGSIFSFTIQAGVAAIVAPQAPPLAAYQGKRIGLIDGNPTSEAIHSQILQRAGVQVYTWQSDTDPAMQIARFQSVDLILWDVDTTQAKDVSSISILQSQLPHVPYIFLSAAKLNMHNTLSSSSAYRIITKPVRHSDLLRNIAELLGKKPTVQSVAKPIRNEIDLSAFSILLVEDNKVNQRVAKSMLRKFNARVEVAQNGQEAVNFVRLRTFDLILMDMQMPIMDGIEATKVIRQIPEIEQPVIMAMTANVAQEDRQRCLDAGMDDFLPKPIKLTQLRKELAQWLLSQSAVDA